MIRPVRMKRVELTVLDRDADRIIEYLGSTSVMHLVFDEEHSETAAQKTAEAAQNTEGAPVHTEARPASGPENETSTLLAAVREALSWLGLGVESEPGVRAAMASADERSGALELSSRIKSLAAQKIELETERRRIEDALSEASAFADLNAPFANLDQLSYMTLRIGRLDPNRKAELEAALGDRAVLVNLGQGDRFLAAASRKGRFTLDTELKKAGFQNVSVPEGFTGVPSELLEGLRQRLAQADADLAELEQRRAAEAAANGETLQRLASSLAVSEAVEHLRARLRSSASACQLSGWVAAKRLSAMVAELERLTSGRIAIRVYDPEELPAVRGGEEKVPVSLSHGPFVHSFERMVFSYGSPLYGTIDPTPFVAFSFVLLFGLMFGDVGQGFVLFLLGLLTAARGPKLLSGFRRFSIPLVAVGLASMAMGLLNGEVFANEHLLVAPTRALTAFLTGHPVDRILQLMPEQGSLGKLFAFFGFTVGVGVLINSTGLVINIVNQLSLRRWDHALFGKTGLAGASLFWYALFFGVRVALGGQPAWFDALGLGLPLFLLFFGHPLWRILSGKRPVFEHGLLVFFVEGIVELLETASSYISNTVSFLRVGAFALSHAVLSFIVFTLVEMVGTQAQLGPLLGLLVSIIGNAVIIVLEGLIVAIQVVRLQYYEFFSKFFTETGIEFEPFRFRKEA